MVRKSTRGVSIAAIVAVAVALAYTAIYILQRYYELGDGSLPGIALLIVWLIVAAVLLYGLVLRSKQRDAIMRRYYLSPRWVYNHEIGYAPIEKIIPDKNAYEFVGFAAESLAEMSYGFDVAEPPADFIPRFLVTSNQFKFHRTGDGIVIDQWRGDVQRIDTSETGRRTFVKLGTYSNARELARLLADNEAFVHRA